TIECADFSPKRGLFGSVARLISGAGEVDKIDLPFDLVALDGSLFLVCQNLPALVEVFPEKKRFALHTDDAKTLRYPVALCRGGDGSLFISDSESGTVFRYLEGKLEPFISAGLNRPTGICADTLAQRLYVVDTEEHTALAFNFAGERLTAFGASAAEASAFQYPTFAVALDDGSILINDALNYQIKRLSATGEQLSVFGFEGDVPGSFARPKGLAVDSDGHIYVVDNLFDNVQIFNPEGQPLLVIGAGGQEIGRFWSPAGIDIVSDTIYVADTFNNRIQVLRYLGGEK
ncbi:MAG TPA: hypothetical protein VLB27_09125, partial [candidate division Zixibacteria bacterium]|nr:hypothetical protein [candidate division Zixibacteria bacterium]